jgi:pimeloyl-ACP methyl ester carboxylesterase
MAHQMPQVEGVKHSFLAAGDLNFHVAEAGEGEPVVLLHGWPQHWYCWRLVMPRLAERHRVIAIDLRGFGWTDIAWQGFEKENMADDVVRVLEALEVERASVVGHDWGAWIGGILALRRPELVERLVCLSSPPPLVDTRVLKAAPRFRYMAGIAAPTAIKRMSRPGYVARLVKRWSRDRENLGDDVRRIYGRDLRASTRARAAMLLYRTFLTKEIGPVLRGRYRDRRLQVPTRIIYGDRDPVSPSVLFEGHEQFADDLQVEAVTGAGHFLPEERPDLVVDRLLEFLAPASATVA